MLKFAYYLFFLGTDYTESTDFLYSFFREIRVIRA